MADKYVNQAEKDGILHDIHDSRIPELTNEDVGKSLLVGEDGQISIGNRDEQKTYLHKINYSERIQEGTGTSELVILLNITCSRNIPYTEEEIRDFILNASKNGSLLCGGTYKYGSDSSRKPLMKIENNNDVNFQAYFPSYNGHSIDIVYSYWTIQSNYEATDNVKLLP